MSASAWCRAPDNFLVWKVFYTLKWVMRSEIRWKNKWEVFFIQQHESFLKIDHFFLTLRSHSSVHVQHKTFVLFFSLFPFTLVGILIVFMGNITPKIFLSTSIRGFYMRILRIYACYLEHCWWIKSTPPKNLKWSVQERCHRHASMVQGITFKMAAVTVENCQQKVKKRDQSGNMLDNIYYMDNLNVKWNIKQVNIILIGFMQYFWTGYQKVDFLFGPFYTVGQTLVTAAILTLSLNLIAWCGWTINVYRKAQAA